MADGAADVRRRAAPRRRGVQRSPVATSQRDETMIGWARRAGGRALAPLVFVILSVALLAGPRPVDAAPAMSGGTAEELSSPRIDVTTDQRAVKTDDHMTVKATVTNVSG